MDADATLVQDAAQVEQSLELSRHVEQPPSQVPGFEIERRLGEGAFGSVWLAREQNTGKQVAVKFYTHRRGLDWSLLNREVEKLSVLYTSRNIVRLLNVGWDNDPPYYVMEYLENGSLASFLTQGPLPAHEAVRIAKSVLHALVHAHGSGILHCDLKPANVLLDADFEPRLCDFGQSRLSDEQKPALGTLFYMAPEQADLKAVPDARWDVYALGALLYHMLSGEPPYRTAENERAVENAESLETRLAAYRRLVRQGNRPANLRSLPGVDKRLAEIVERCLSVNPEKRYANAQAVLDELELRDRQRARKPLLYLGVIGPGLLLLAMAYFLYQFMVRAEQDAQKLLTTRAVESDVQAAQILARGVERDLRTRATSLEQTAQQISASESLLKAIDSATGKSREERETMFAELKSLKERSDKFRANIGIRPDESWLVTDRHGMQVWREPYSNKTIGFSYAHRDYFHGTGKSYQQGAAPPGIAPIRAAHVSVPFTSDETNQYMVAISVPIWDPERQNVVGVLARTMHLGKLLADYLQRERIEGENEVERTLALVEYGEGKLIDHPWMTADKVKTLGSETFNRLKVSDEVREKMIRLANPESGSTEAAFVEDYSDPVGSLEGEATHYGGKWLAAFAIIDGAGWAAVVQEPREAALDPVEEMKQGLVRYGFIALLLSCALIGVLWYFVGRALNDRSQHIWSSRSDSSRPTSFPTSPTDR